MPDQRNALRHFVQIQIPRASHTLQRDIVNVTTAQRAHFGIAAGERGRRQQEDRINLYPLHRRRKLGALLWRIIDDQHAIHTRRLRITGESLQAISLDRIGIAHQHHRRRRILLAEFTHQSQHTMQRHALRQRPFRCALYRRPIRHRVGKRHTQLDDVGSARDQRAHQRQRHIGMRITSGNEGDQRLALPGGKRLESGIYTAHISLCKIVRINALDCVAGHCHRHRRMHAAAAASRSENQGLPWSSAQYIFRTGGRIFRRRCVCPCRRGRRD